MISRVKLFLKLGFDWFIVLSDLIHHRLCCHPWYLPLTISDVSIHFINLSFRKLFCCNETTLVLLLRLLYQSHHLLNLLFKEDLESMVLSFLHVLHLDTSYSLPDSLLTFNDTPQYLSFVIINPAFKWSAHLTHIRPQILYLFTQFTQLMLGELNHSLF